MSFDIIDLILFLLLKSLWIRPHQLQVLIGLSVTIVVFLVEGLLIYSPVAVVVKTVSRLLFAGFALNRKTVKNQEMAPLLFEKCIYIRAFVRPAARPFVRAPVALSANQSVRRFLKNSNLGKFK